MGIETDPDDNGYEAGDDCNICWGVGKPFGDIPTPKEVTATFEGVISCNAGWVPDGPYTLEQLDAAPCRWEYEVTDEIKIVYSFFGDKLAQLFVRHYAPINKNYFSDTGVNCETVFANSFAIGDCPAVLAYGGFGVIT